MADALIDIPIWLDMTAVVVGALAGAVFATQRGVTVMGVLLVAVSTGFGGGLVRDTLLQIGTPLPLQNPGYLPAVAIAAIVGMGFARYASRLSKPLMVLDAVALGMFTVLGVERAQSAGLPVGSCIFIGVVAACAGGIVRDLLVGDAPEVLRDGPWDASASAVGAALFLVVVLNTDVSTVFMEWATIGLIALLRILSVLLGWHAPMAAHVEGVVGRPLDQVRKRIARPGDPGEA